MLGRRKVIFTGPPVQKEDDERIVQTLMESPGKRVVCGGTTANIVARQLGHGIDVDLETGTESVPATGRIEGIDLVTEGTLTVTKALEILREKTPEEELTLKVDGASRLVLALLEADEIRMLVGFRGGPDMGFFILLRRRSEQVLGAALGFCSSEPTMRSLVTSSQSTMSGR